MAHKQKFKDPLSRTCQVSSERRVLDLKLEVNQRPGFNPLLLDYFLFSRIKTSDANIAIMSTHS